MLVAIEVAMVALPVHAGPHVPQAELHPLRAIPGIGLEDARDVDRPSRREPAGLQGPHPKADRLMLHSPARQYQLQVVGADHAGRGDPEPPQHHRRFGIPRPERSETSELLHYGRQEATRFDFHITEQPGTRGGACERALQDLTQTVAKLRDARLSDGQSGGCRMAPERVEMLPAL